MRLLLDTHAFLWAVSAPEKLSPRARRSIEDGSNQIYVSAATAWELAIKSRLGRLEPEVEDLERSVPEQIERHAFQPLPVQVRHALRVASLPDVHRDPFDRLLIAQAMLEGLAMVTADRELKRYAVKVVW